MLLYIVRLDHISSSKSVFFPLLSRRRDFLRSELRLWFRIGEEVISDSISSFQCFTDSQGTSDCDVMDKDEQFVLNEVDYKTPKQSPQTFPMDKIRQSRYPQMMSTLLSPVTPKRNSSITNAKSLLLQCLRDSKSDPIPRRRFPAACSDEGVLMDGVLVTSASGKKVSDSPSSCLGISARSSVLKSLQKNSEFSSARKQEVTRPQHSCGGKENMLANSSSTEVETPKPANPSKLKASAKPFILTPKSSPRIASPVPLLRVPCGHDPHFLWGSPHPQLPLSHLYPRPLHDRQLLLPPASPHGTNLFLPHYLARSPGPTGNKMAHDFDQSPARKDPRLSLPTTPFSAHTPISTDPVASPSHGSSLYLPASLDELDTEILKLDLSPPSDGLKAVTAKSDWSPCDDGLPTFTQAQTDFTKSQNRILPDDVFEHYKYRERLQTFTQLWLDDKASST